MVRVEEKMIREAKESNQTSKPKTRHQVERKPTWDKPAAVPAKGEEKQSEFKVEPKPPGGYTDGKTPEELRAE
jgi:hypothetical protein